MNWGARLQHWRDERQALEETMRMDLSFKSLARPVLEKDLRHAEQMIAYYEAKLARTPSLQL